VALTKLDFFYEALCGTFYSYNSILFSGCHHRSAVLLTTRAIYWSVRCREGIKVWSIANLIGPSEHPLQSQASSEISVACLVQIAMWFACPTYKCYAGFSIDVNFQDVMFVFKSWTSLEKNLEVAI